MKKKIFNIIIILIIVTSIVLIVIGAMKIYNVNKELELGIEEVEDIFKTKNAVEINQEAIETSVSIEGEENSQTMPSKAIGIITFKLNKIYKTAIYNNITKETLKKGAGRASGTSMPNQIGNCVLYSHRDAGFRALWDIKIEDKIEIETLDSTVEYEVRKITVTDPTDDMIFAQSSETKVTLVTCYPFVYAGPSNQRCVVECYKI